jgi:hypothetical protein
MVTIRSSLVRAAQSRLEDHTSDLIRPQALSAQTARFLESHEFISNSGRWRPVSLDGRTRSRGDSECAGVRSDFPPLSLCCCFRHPATQSLGALPKRGDALPRTSTFVQWLRLQAHRRDDVGWLAKHSRQSKFPSDAQRLCVLLRYADAPRTKDPLLVRSAIKVAHAEWRATRRLAA